MSLITVTVHTDKFEPVELTGILFTLVEISIALRVNVHTTLNGVPFTVTSNMSTYEAGVEYKRCVKLKDYPND